MYQISTTNEILGYAEVPEFCYLLPSGSPQVVHPKDKDKATGIIYAGTIYNLPNHDDFEGAETATAAECDAGYVLTHQAEQIAAHEAVEADTDALMVDHEMRLVELELGLNEGV